MNQDKHWLVRRIDNLGSRSCCREIFQLILFHEVPYMKNSNGVFFDTRDVSDVLFRTLEAVVARYEHKKLMKEEEDKINWT